MSEGKIVTSEVKKLIGKAGKPTVVEIEKGFVRRLAEAIEDDNPLWRDADFAKKTKYGGIIAPPGLLCASLVSGGDSRPEISLPVNRILDGGGDWEIIKPIKVGDVITSTTGLFDIYEKEGKLGTMVFQVFETIHTNQKGEIVAKSHGTNIRY